MPRYARQDMRTRDASLRSAGQEKEGSAGHVEAGRRPKRSEVCLAILRKDKTGRNAKLILRVS
jgi:hypothetical protein